MNFYTLAKRLEKEIENLHINGNIPYQQAEQQQIEQFIKTCKFGIKLMNTFKSLQNHTYNTMYFITIRPDETKVSFQEFYNDIYKLINRKCFLSFKLSFEQKGTDSESMGRGFHVHIIAMMKQSSPGNVLRDVYSSVKNYTAYNCIDVKKLFTQQDVDNVEQYITEYKSDDDHKIATKECDSLWRDKNNLKSIYNNINDLVLPNHEGNNILNMLSQKQSLPSSPSGRL